MSAAAPGSWRIVGIDELLRRLGDWLMRHQRAIRLTQWVVVLVYTGLLIVPLFVPLPTRLAHIWNDVGVFAQFAFWGIWWPAVLVSMVLVGRLWCGLLCPEGSLSEAASAYSRGRAIPHWLRWKGWPFVAFAATTVYGQMISVYQYPAPAALILGLSTFAAVVAALLWGRHKRVWCRYLCPVTGVFAVLSKLAPIHFRVDTGAWNPARHSDVNCAPLVPIRSMRGASACHMCGRCSGAGGAIVLARRSPSDQIVRVAAGEANAGETLLILVGLFGIAAGAFHWSGSELFVTVKQSLAAWLVDHDVLWPLEGILPWWILTNYPEQSDVMTPLDGIVLLAYIASAALAIGAGLGGLLAAAARLLGRWRWQTFHHLVQSLIPLAGCGVILGLSITTVTLLRHDGFDLDFVGPLRAAMLAGAAAWSLWLGWRITGSYAGGRTRQLLAMLPLAAAVAAGTAVWASLFWSW